MADIEGLQGRETICVAETYTVNSLPPGQLATHK